MNDGDILVVDRNAPVRQGAVVLAVVAGELVVRRVATGPGGRPELQALQGKSPPIRGENEEALPVWGVVLWTIHKVGN